VFETMKEAPHCRMAPEKERKKRLKELGRDPCELCDCHKVKKGNWSASDPKDVANKPRTFDTVCRGRAFRSRGFVQLQDVLRRFKRLSREVWEAQQECLRPDPAGLVHKWLNPNKHILPWWLPKPEYGSVYRSWDWGGRNPHAVLFHQILDVPVELADEAGHVFAKLQEGDVVTFDEIYTDRIPAIGDLAVRVFERTQAWHEHGFRFRVTKDFCDPAGFSAKADARKAAAENGYPEPDFASRPVPRIESVQKHVEWGEDDMLYIVGPMCINTLDEYSVYHFPKDKDGKALSEDPEKVDDHAMDSKRYFIWNVYKLSQHAPSEGPGRADSTPVETAKLGKRRPLLGGGGLPPGDGSMPVGSTAQRYLTQDPMGGASVRRADLPGVVRHG
jgi:hypothetical protein